MALVRASAETLAGPAERRKRIVSPSAEETKHIWADLIEVVNEHIDGDPRSLQKEIGPSEVGDPCDYCLGARLAGLEQKRNGDGWFTYIGKVVHDDLDANVLPKHPERWATAERLWVGDIDGRRIEGTTDARWIKDPLTVVDFKIVGRRTLEQVMFDAMKEVYEYQVDIYGRGFELAGNPPEHVAVAFLPREDRHVRRGYWYSKPYDPAAALRALQRAELIAMQVRMFGVLAVLPTLTKLDGCYDCARWILPDE